MKKAIGVAVLVLLAVGLGVWLWRTRTGSSSPLPVGVDSPVQSEMPREKSKEKPPEVITKKSREELLARGREVAKTAPKLGSAEWLDWQKNLSAEDRWAWALAEDERMTPPEPTPEQKDALRIEDWRPPSSTPLFPAKVLFNYRPMLRMDKSVGIRPLQVETVRNENGKLVSTMWARRAKDSIVVDWDNKSVVKGNVDSTKSVGGPSPQYVPPGMLLSAGNGELGFTGNSTGFLMKWDSDSTVYPLALDTTSVYAFGSVKGRVSGRIESVVVIDTVNKKLAGTIPVPKANNGLHCIFQPNDYLMVFDYQSQWIMLLDLKKPLVSGVKATISVSGQ